MITKTLHKGIMILAVMLVMSFVPTSAFADTVPALSSEKASLGVKMVYYDEDVETKINGADITIYKVASMSVKDGSAQFKLEKDFKSTNINFDGMTASQSLEAAETCADVVKKSGASGRTETSEGEGLATFGGLDHGVYLVVQTGASGEAKKYSYFIPYLMMVPSMGADGNWNYNVVMEPKEMIAEPPTNETPEPPGVTGEGGEESTVTVGGDGEDEPDNNTTYEEEEDEPEYNVTTDDEEEETPKKSKRRVLIDTSDPTQMTLLVVVIALAAACLFLLVTRKKYKEEEKE